MKSGYDRGRTRHEQGVALDHCTHTPSKRCLAHSAMHRCPSIRTLPDALVSTEKSGSRQLTLSAHGTQALGSFLVDPLDQAMLDRGQWPIEHRLTRWRAIHTMWKEWPHLPMTGVAGHERQRKRGGWGGDVRREQSSPGYLQVGQVPSNWTRQMPHTSSSGMSHRQAATAFHSLIRTFMW